MNLPVRSPRGMTVGQDIVSSSPFAPRPAARFDPAQARVYPTLVAPEKRSVWADYKLSAETGKLERKPKGCTVEGCQRAAVYPLNAPAYCGQHQVWVAQQAVNAITEPAPVAAPAAQPLAPALLLLPAETPSTVAERADAMRRTSRRFAASSKRFWSSFTVHSGAPFLMPAPLPPIAAWSVSTTPGEKLAYRARQCSNGGPAQVVDTPVKVGDDLAMRTWRHRSTSYSPDVHEAANAHSLA